MADRLVVIGGGVTGLTSAYLAAKAGHQVTVLEASAKFGGLLETFPIGGSRLEHYYHHFFTHDAEIRWLVDELGISDHLRYLPATMGVFRDGRNFDFNSPRDLLKFSPMSLAAKLRFGLTSLYLGKLSDWRNWESTPALEWFYRFAGRSATDSIWRPMLEIKFGPYADQVPVAWIVGRLRQRMGSREKGDEKLGYLEGSLQTLLDALLRALAALNVELVGSARLTGFKSTNGMIDAAETTAGEFAADQFLATIPTVYLAPLLQSHTPDYADHLARIEYFGAVCTILEMDRPLSETYWLNVADPGFPFGGVIEHTNFIPPSHYAGKHIAYLSRYFESTNALATQSETSIASEMTAPLKRIYPNFFPDQILNTSVFRTATAATVCDLNFSQRVPSARSPLKNFFLATMAHIYPDERSCNNSIRVAAEVCKLINPEIPAVPYGSSLSGEIGIPTG